MLALAGMIAAASLILALSLGDVLSQVSVLRGGEQLRKHHAVTFTPFYTSGGVSNVGDDTLEYLADQIRDGKAYSVIVNNAGIDDPDVIWGRHPIILIGDAIPLLFPDLQLCSPAPCAMRGAHISPFEEESARIAGVEIPVVGTLPDNATLFDPNAPGLPLDSRIVVRLPATMLSRLHPIEREELLTRAVLLAPSRKSVERYVSGSAEGGLNLVPFDVAVDQPRKFREAMVVSAVYVVGLAAFLALVFMVFFLAAQTIIRAEARSFVIRRLYGATTRHLGIRVASFLVSTVLILPGVLLILLALIGGPFAAGAGWVGVTLVGSTLLLWGRSMYDVMNVERHG